MKIYFFCTSLEATINYLTALPDRQLAATFVRPSFEIPSGAGNWLKVGEVEIDGGMLTKAQVKAAALALRTSLSDEAQAKADAEKTLLNDVGTEIAGL